VGQLGPLLERLASSTEVYYSDRGELLELSIRDERQPAAPLSGA
jgi:hypothetical protein